MKRNRSKISLLISLGIHFVLILVLSPFIVKHLSETDTNLSLFFFKAKPQELVKRRPRLEHQSVQLKRTTDIGAPALSLAAPKYAQR